MRIEEMAWQNTGGTNAGASEGTACPSGAGSTLDAATATASPAATAAKKPVNWVFVSIMAIAVLLACACLAWVCMRVAFASNADERVVVITDGDGTTQRIPITDDGSYTISTSLGENTIVVSYGSVYMASADCPGQDCVEQGAISNAGEIIVCLPHKLIVNIEGGQASTVDSVAS